jgi:glycosyltransferase involved in cell wall biosynthesis
MKVKTIHDVELKEGENGLRWRYLHFFSFKCADKYIILSRKYIKNLAERGINKSNIVVIPLACFSTYRDEDSNNSDFIFHNKLIFFGRIVAYKGLNVLLDAMKLVIKTIPDIKLVIAGDGDISPYKRLMDDLQNNIELYNFWISNDNVKKYFTEIDVSIMPYIEATQSGVVPLSYSFAKPVIVSDVGALSEQVYKGETGFVIEPGNPVVLAESIIKIMMDKELLCFMSNKCDIVYQNELTWDSSAKKILELL